MTEQHELIVKTLLLCIAATLFGARHTIDAARQIKKKRFETYSLSLIGGILVLLAVVLCVAGSPLDSVIGMEGCLFICINPIVNRTMSSNLPWQQDMIRVQNAAPDQQFAAAGSMVVFLNAILHGRSSGLRWYHHAAHIAISISLSAGFMLL